MGFLLIFKKQLMRISLGASIYVFTVTPAMVLSMGQPLHPHEQSVAALEQLYQPAAIYPGPIPSNAADSLGEKNVLQSANFKKDSGPAMLIDLETAQTSAQHHNILDFKHPHSSALTFGPSSNFVDGKLPIAEGDNTVPLGSNHSQLSWLDTSNSVEYDLLVPLFLKYLTDFTDKTKSAYHFKPTDLKQLEHPSYRILIHIKAKTQFIKILDSHDVIRPLDELTILYQKLMRSIYGLQVQEFSKFKGQNFAQMLTVYFENIFQWLNAQIFSPDKSLPICGSPHIRLTEKDFEKATLGNIQMKLLDFFSQGGSPSEMASAVIGAYHKHLQDLESKYQPGMSYIQNEHRIHMSHNVHQIFLILSNLDTNETKRNSPKIENEREMFSKLLHQTWETLPKGVSKYSLKDENPILPIGVSRSNHVQILKSQIGEPIEPDALLSILKTILESVCLLHKTFLKKLPRKVANYAKVSDLIHWFAQQITIQKEDGLPIWGYISHEINNWNSYKFSPLWLSLVQYISESRNHPMSNINKLRAFVLAIWYDELFSPNEFKQLTEQKKKSGILGRKFKI
ncbi:hypothetical protein PGT21_025170 [Puccinia graminis f. sp. tritici]|uniref:Uncharacterized protein n=1 Tax=Puccinia graminis f. sp. tritici TaxID=56615 RepID=A0A5B0ND95_PUCGR|nr:hypothetical protein PGT21_025170 [Puccinia graminis f. sp. tritici]KAA1113788.1 hypothetical protein PGTUg99_020783 [Puccinia graminis f. sp. tritici]